MEEQVEQVKKRPYLNSKQACEFLGIKELYTLYCYIYEGKLKAYKMGGDHKSRRHWRFKIEDLRAFVEGGKAGAETTHTESNNE